MDKPQILSNVENLTAEQLYGYISRGTVNLEELRQTERLDNAKRKAIIALSSKYEEEDENTWNTGKYTESGCRAYLEKYPNGIHVKEARDEIDHFNKMRREADVLKRRVIDGLRSKPNSFTPGMLQKYLKEGTIKRADLEDSGIPSNIIDRLDNIVSPKLQLGKVPEFIPDGFTEVYFWGIPGSGKTCALAAILNTSERSGYLEIAEGPGFDYMTKLKNIFVNTVAILPPPSPVETTQYLPFVLKKGKDKPRSVALIELSGEIFECFVHKSADQLGNLSDTHRSTFDSLINFLNGSNRKIHFFFIDYEKENLVDANGYRQSDYLQAAATFFKNNDIFRKKTDAIYIVLTKSDLMPCAEEDRVAYAKEYLKRNDFIAFTNSLKERCRQHSINGGKLTVEPFSLGKVYFQQLCSLDRTASSKIIDILLDRIPPNGKSILDIFNQ